MIVKEYLIGSPLGMHARPATNLIKLVRQYKSAIHLQKNDQKIPVKSMINILSLAIKTGDTILFFIDGEDENEMAQAIDQFCQTELHE